METGKQDVYMASVFLQKRFPFQIDEEIGKKPELLKWVWLKCEELLIEHAFEDEDFKKDDVAYIWLYYGDFESMDEFKECANDPIIGRAMQPLLIWQNEMADMEIVRIIEGHPDIQKEMKEEPAVIYY